MSGGDDESAIANEIADVAEDLQLGAREVRDASQVLEVLGVSEEDDGIEAVLDGVGELLNGVGDDGGTPDEAVSTCLIEWEW